MSSRWKEQTAEPIRPLRLVVKTPYLKINCLLVCYSLPLRCCRHRPFSWTGHSTCLH